MDGINGGKIKRNSEANIFHLWMFEHGTFEHGTFEHRTFEHGTFKHHTSLSL